MMTSSQLRGKIYPVHNVGLGVSHFSMTSKSLQYVEAFPQTAKANMPDMDHSAMIGSAVPKNGARRCVKHSECMVLRHMYV